MPEKTAGFSGIVAYLPVISAVFIFLIHKVSYSYLSELFFSMEHPLLRFLFDRAAYFVLYPLAGWFSFKWILERNFPEKRFTPEGPAGNLQKMLFYALISAFFLILVMLFFHFFIPSDNSGVLNRNTGKLPSVSFLILFTAASVILTPVMEEIFYREFLGKFLAERMGWETGIFLQALLFAFAHKTAILPVMFTVGIACGIMYFKFGLKGSILTHSLYNALVLMLAFYFKDGIFS